MHPETFEGATSSAATQVFWAPLGSDLSDVEAFKPLGFTNVGFEAFDEDLPDGWDRPITLPAVTVSFDLGPLPTRAYRILFGRRPPKRVRKAWDRARKQLEQAERDLFRGAQRRAIGMTGVDQ